MEASLRQAKLQELHLDSHPVAVARLTRFLVQNDMPFVLHDAFMVDDDQIVFEKGGFALAGEAG
jgi:hypothetical protein